MLPSRLALLLPIAVLAAACGASAPLNQPHEPPEWPLPDRDPTAAPEAPAAEAPAVGEPAPDASPVPTIEDPDEAASPAPTDAAAEAAPPSEDP